MGHSVASQGSESFCFGFTPGPWALRTREFQNSPALNSHSCISSFIYSSIQQACIEPYTALGKGLGPENTIGTKDSHFQWENADCNDRVSTGQHGNLQPSVGGVGRNSKAWKTSWRRKCLSKSQRNREKAFYTKGTACAKAIKQKVSPISIPDESLIHYSLSFSWQN